MVKGKDDLLMQLLRCGSLDLALIDDVGYDFCDILEYCDGAEWVVSVGLNGVMRLVFEYGFEQIAKAINDRIEELENEDLDEDGEKELSALRVLNPDDDMETYHNYLDTHVWCKEHYDTYRKYLSEALDDFAEGTGFDIGGDL